MVPLLNIFVRRCCFRVFPAVCLGVVLLIGSAAHASYGVDISQAGTTLYVDCDNNANTVSIVGAAENGDPVYGTVVVYVGDSTPIYEDVEEIVITLGDGDNFLAMDRVSVMEGVSITAGGGHDRIVIGGWGYGTSHFLGAGLSINAGDGDNRIRIDDTYVSSETIETGSGADDVYLGMSGEFISLGNTLIGDLTVSTGAGDDLVAALGTHVWGETLIETSAGNDYVNFSLALFVEEARTAPKGLRTPTRTSEPSRTTSTKDLTSLRDSSFFDLGNVFHGLTIDTDEGSDAVFLEHNEVHEYTAIHLGDNADGVPLLDSNDFYGDFSATGGNGQDTLNEGDGNYYEHPPQFNSFEL